jgi:hypothetical protein
LSLKQYGGNIDNSNSSDVEDMDVSYDCTMNRLPLKNPLLMMNGKNQCIRNMMLSSRMGHGIWWTLHMELKRLAAIGIQKQVEIIWIT